MAEHELPFVELDAAVAAAELELGLDNALECEDEQHLICGGCHADALGVGGCASWDKRDGVRTFEF